MWKIRNLGLELTEKRRKAKRRKTEKIEKCDKKWRQNRKRKLESIFPLGTDFWCLTNYGVWSDSLAHKNINKPWRQNNKKITPSAKRANISNNESVTHVWSKI